MGRFKEHLAAQLRLRFIERSCQAFDAGDEAEAQRIAASVRVICHQTGTSTSLLTHLGATGVSMLSTACSPLGPGAPSNLAHVNATLKSDYMAIKSGTGLVATFLRAGGDPVEIPLESHSIATLRQIGYEVLHSPGLLALRH